MIPTRAKSDLAREVRRERVAADLAEHEQTTALSRIAPGPEDIDLAVVGERLETIRQFQVLVKSQLIDGLDYGKIPGCDKPVLLKPGGEKLTKLLGLCESYEIIERIEDWDKPFFYFLVRCQLRSIVTGQLISESIASANSRESKWAGRWAWPSDVPPDVDRKGLPTRTVNTKRGTVTQYRIDNPDIYSQTNTILKMAEKRAMVSAALSAGRLSGLFTVDLEDQQPNAKAAPEPEPEPTPGANGERDEILAKVQKCLVDCYGADNKDRKAESLWTIFGQRTWRAVSNMPMDILRKGLAVLENQIQQQAGREPGATEADEFDFFLAAGGG